MRPVACCGAADVRLCVLIPVYDHEHAIGRVVADIVALGLPVLLVDDGSGPACAAELDRLAAEQPVRLLRRAVNGGKGAAVMDGMRAAAAAGYSHVLQVDADGQHALADLPGFVAMATARPDALVCGYPIYDDSVPRVRLYGRYLTHIWVWINTLSFEIRDSMCGLRVYPLAPTLALLAQVSIGQRMDFDTEILVHLHWRRVPMLWRGIQVQYPLDGVSHFRPWADNVRISCMHARLFFGMLWRLPRLLWWWGRR